MKRPSHKKNRPNNPTEETPVIDERNLIDSDEALNLSIEDRIAMYWTENKPFVIGCFAILVASILMVNGFRIYKNYAESSLQTAYTEAKANDLLDSFVRTNSDTKIGGFAALEIADEAFETEAYPKAIEFYQIAAKALNDNILASRAELGRAFAIYRSGKKDQGLAELGNIAATGQFSENIRAEAAYHLAVNAFIVGQTEIFQSYVDQIENFEQAWQWNQRLQYYVQQNR